MNWPSADRSPGCPTIRGCPAARTGREFLLAVGRLYDIDDDRLMDHVDRLLAVFDLTREGDWPINSYSNGQQKEIAICAALVTEAPVLIMDEPFSGGLDPSGILALKRILKHLTAERKATVVMSTPVAELVEELAQRIVVLRDGQVAAYDTADGLRRSNRLLRPPGRRPRKTLPSAVGRQSAAILRGADEMIGSIIRWFRRTLPPTWAILSAIGVLAIMEGLYLWVRWCINVPEVAEEMSSQFLHMRDGFVAMIMFVYGIFRVMAFHPLFRPKYRAWLEQTPWTRKTASPRADPSHLARRGSPRRRFTFSAWIDARPFVAVGSVSFRLSRRFGPFVLANRSLVDGLSRLFRSGIGVPNGRNAFHLPWNSWLGICYSHDRASHSVSAVPVDGCQAFQQTDKSAAIIQSFGGNSPPQQKTFSIWPYNQLLNVPAERIISRCDGFLGPLLAAWWLYALTSNFASVKDRSDFLYCLFVIVVGIAFGCRAFIYMAMYWPPISLLGRIFTRRWIIPGYDYVVLAPLCILLTAIIGGIMINYVGQAYNSITYPLTMAAVCIVALNLGPSLGKWRLTGHYRLIYSNNNTTEQNQIKL